MDVDYSVDEEVLELADHAWQALIKIRREDLRLVAAAKRADWDKRESIVAGTMLGSNCYWCRGDSEDTVRLLVGHDDETWELAVTLPARVVDSIDQITARL